jgi:hypothetical protein
VKACVDRSRLCLSPDFNVSDLLWRIDKTGRTETASL